MRPRNGRVIIPGVVLGQLIAAHAVATPITVVSPPDDPNVTVVGNAVFVGDSAVNGNLKLEASGGITDATDASISVVGNASFTDTSAVGIALDGANNNYGSLTFNSDGPVVITEVDAMSLAGASSATTAVLAAGGSITDEPGAVLDVDSLDLSASESIVLEGKHQIGTLGSVNRGGALILSDLVSDLTIAGPIGDGVGEVLIATDGALTVNTAIAAVNDAVTLSGNGVTFSPTADVDAGNGDVDIDGGAGGVSMAGMEILSTGTVSITGDEIELGPSTQVGGAALGLGAADAVNLLPATAGTAINLGDAAVPSTPGLDLTNDELNRIEARTLRIGSDGSPDGSKSGAITIGGLSIGGGTVDERVIVDSGAGIDIVGPIAIGGDIELTLLASDMIALGANIDVGAGQILFGADTYVNGQIDLTASTTSFLDDLFFDLSGTDPLAHDGIDTFGDVFIEETLRLFLDSTFDPMAGDFFDLITAASIDISSASFFVPTLGSGLFWDFSLFAEEDGRETLRFSVLGPPVSVPEPGTMVLFLAGLVWLAGLRFVRRRNTA